MSIRNVVESIVGGDEPSDPESPESPADDGEDFGGMSDEGDLGGLDDGDGFGDVDDDGDEFGATAGGQVDELEHRIDELETEIDDLSSTVETVRTENEQISSSVADVEENVRKLLDIYEMVTKGVNPFADDVDAGAAGGSMGGDFGLFDDDGGDDGSDAAVDEDVAEADPEGFFDEDLDEEDLTTDDEPAVDDVFDDAGSEEPAETSDAHEAESAAEPADDGTSFEDLKAEYESADGVEEPDPEPEQEAESAGQHSGTETPPDGPRPAAGEGSEASGTPEPASAAAAPDADPSDQRPPGPDTDSAETPRANGGHPTDETAPTPADASAVGGVAHEQSARPERTNGGGSRGGQQSPAADHSPHTAEAPPGSGKPYLPSVPGGYATDIVVTEWLEFLVDEAGIREAANALEYYESIGWLGPRARERLEQRLGGMQGTGDGTLDTEDHARSLQYVSQLNDAGAAVGPALLSDGGGSDGVQR